MAYKASDGTPFTNKPQMRAHEAKLSSNQKKAKGLFPEHKPEPIVKEQKPMSRGAHATSSSSGPVTCPNCGTTFDPGGENPSVVDSAEDNGQSSAGQEMF